MKNSEHSLEELDARAEDAGASRACCGTCVVTCNVCFIEPEELDAEPELRASRGCYCLFCAGLCTPSKEPEELDARAEDTGAGRVCGACFFCNACAQGPEELDAQPELRGSRACVACIICGPALCSKEPEGLNRH